jgi:hypothetical protein
MRWLFGILGVVVGGGALWLANALYEQSGEVGFHSATANVIKAGDALGFALSLWLLVVAFRRPPRR